MNGLTITAIIFLCLQCDSSIQCKKAVILNHVRNQDSARVTVGR